MPPDPSLLPIRLLQLGLLLVFLTFLAAGAWLRSHLRSSRQWKAGKFDQIERSLRQTGQVSSESFLAEAFLGATPRAEIRQYYLEKLSHWNLRLESFPDSITWIKSLPDRVRLSFIDEHAVAQLIALRDTVAYAETGLQLAPETLSVLLQLLRAGFDTGQAESLPEHPPSSSPSIENSPWEVAWLHTPDLNLGSSFGCAIPAWVSRHARVTLPACSQLLSLLTDGENQGRTYFIVSALPFSQDVRYFIRERIGKIYALDLILLDLEDIFDLLVSAERALTLRSIAARQIDLSKISPFTLTGPTSDEMFFGREGELRLIVENVHRQSFAVVGGRRIGKSSMLVRLHRLLLPAAGFYAVYMDLSTILSYEDFLSRRLLKVNPEPPAGFPAALTDLLQSELSLPGGRCLVLLLDEVDKVVPTDQANKWPIFKALRAMANTGIVQVVLSGEQSLRDAIRDPASPFFNFSDEIILRPLDLHAVQALVTRSMQLVDVELEDEEKITHKIFEFTAGHPNIVQRLCYRLLESVNAAGEHRIDMALVDQVFASPTFQRDDFLSTIWESATPLEKIISLTMVKEKQARTLKGIRQALNKQLPTPPKAKSIDDALQRLVELRYLLKHSASGYDFAIPAFPTLVQGSLTLDDMLEVLVDEYEEQVK